MASTARIDELKKKFDENPRRYFAPLANEFRKAGDAEQAVMICEEFLPQQPGHMSGHIVYGQALFDLNRLEDARTVFETALTLDPENLIALRHLGDIARTHGDLDSARQWYQRVLEADPRNEEVQALIAALDESPAAAPPSAAAAPAPLEQSTSVDLAPAFEAAAPAPSFESPSAPPPLPHTPPAESLLELDMVEEHALGAPPAVPAPQDPGHTDGFEPMEFSAPSAATGSSGIEDALEPAEFSAPHASVAPLEGLEETAIGAFEARPADARSAEPPTGQTAPPSLPDFEPASDFAAAAASDELPVDIPPEVIAAEAELIEAREATAASAPWESAASAPAAPEPMPTAPDASVAPPAQPASPPRVTPSQPFVTETMAELYVKQGFREQALDVYKLLLAASPENERLRERVAELQPREEVDAGPNVREFFARLAALRPGDQGASAVPPASDDFASLDAFETVPPTSPTTSDATYPGSAASVAPELAGLPMLDDGPPPEREAAAPESPSGEGESAGDGSIDALFGQRPAGQADSSAASALAQAFGSGESDSPPISGRPARAAAGELSLDSVFRDGGARPPRSAQSFSFDQFFSESASADAPAEPGPSPTPSQGTGAQAEPAERSADDIEQFNSWLQGLKQR